MNFGNGTRINITGNKMLSGSMLERTGNGSKFTKNISIDFFDSIVNNTIIPISIKQGIGAEVKLIGDSNLFDLIQFEFSKDGNLTINMSSCNLKNSNLEIEILVPKLIIIEINSIGSMTIDNFNFKDLEIGLSSVGSLNMNNCLVEILKLQSNGTGSFNSKNVEISNYLSVDLASVGNFNLNGTAVIPEAKLICDSTGSIEISQKMLKCKAYCSSVGSMEIRVLNEISGSCTSIGCVNISGNPVIKNCQSGFIGKFKFN